MNEKIECFKQTSDKLYDRHEYKIVSKTGESSVVDNWESAQLIWFQKGSLLSHIEVLDKKTKGFG
jgi:hypothetical protein